jgi:hypothetical protein
VKRSISISLSVLCAVPIAYVTMCMYARSRIAAQWMPPALPDGTVRHWSWPHVLIHDGDLVFACSIMPVERAGDGIGMFFVLDNQVVVAGPD